MIEPDSYYFDLRASQHTIDIYNPEDHGLILSRAAKLIRTINGDKEEEIGKVSWSVILGVQAEEIGEDIIDAADSVTQDIADCAYAFYNSNTARRLREHYCSLYNVLFLEGMEIDPAWRRRGLGLHIIRSVALTEHVEVVALVPHPFVKEGADERELVAGAKKLAKYYARVNFKKLGKTRFYWTDSHRIITARLPDMYARN